MIRMLSPAVVAGLALQVASFAEPQAPPPETGDMTVLFNGKDLTGWDGDPRLWSVKDGAIHGETTSENKTKGNTFLVCTQTVLRDFELRLSFRCNATNNSGIQYRSKHLKARPGALNRWRVRGYQHEIRNQNRLPSVSGFIYDEGGKRKRMCLVGDKAIWAADGKKEVQETLITGAEFARLFKLNDWNDVVIIAQGTHLRHYLNGRLILDFTDHPDVALMEGILAFARERLWAVSAREAECLRY